MAERILLIRHGETHDNVIETSAPAMTRSQFARYLAGGDDATLTERGREQARALGSVISAAGVGRLYISPLQRARDTAAIMATVAPLAPAIVLEELRELIPRSSAVPGDGRLVAIGLRRQLWPSYARMLVSPNSPDRIDRSLRRLRAAWRVITADAEHTTVGVVGHGWSTALLLRTLQADWRWRVGRIDLSPCGVTIVERRRLPA